MDERSISKLTNRMYVSLQIEEKLPLEKYEIYIKPNFNSASWRFSNKKHQIVIGTQIFDNMTHNTSDRDKALYIRSYLYHELAHSIWTHKDLNAIHTKLQKLKFSFSLFNLFEDARIEEKMRKYLKKKFNWLKYETITISENPVDIFYHLIQAEKNKKAIDSIQGNLHFQTVEHFDVVELFYKKAIECTSYEEVIELLKKWYSKFPNTKKYEEQNSSKSYLFNIESTYADDEKFEELIRGLKNTLTTELIRTKTSKPSLTEKKSKKVSLLAETPHKVDFDKKLRDQLLSKMKKLFLSQRRDSSTIIPSKRLNVKNILKRSDKIFKRKNRDKFVKKRISIILDMSGSMYESMKHMRLIVDVLDNMTQNNIIEARLILSGVYKGVFLHETLSMPLEKDILTRIIPHFEAEGLHSSMSANLELLKRSDYVWVLTDGMICEGPLNKKFYTQHKIKLHAFYIGKTLYKKEMEKSFDYIICEDSVQKLANKIFMLIK